jgi:hypothetical protein
VCAIHLIWAPTSDSGCAAARTGLLKPHGLTPSRVRNHVTLTARRREYGSLLSGSIVALLRGDSGSRRPCLEGAPSRDKGGSKGTPSAQPTRAARRWPRRPAPRRAGFGTRRWYPQRRPRGGAYLEGGHKPLLKPLAGTGSSGPRTRGLRHDMPSRRQRRVTLRADESRSRARFPRDSGTKARMAAAIVTARFWRQPGQTCI